MAATHSAITILASTTCTASGSKNGTEVDKNVANAGYELAVCGRCTNGATGPTLACQMNVYIGDASGKKYLFQTQTFDLGNAVVSDRVCYVPAGAMFVNVTFIGNTGQDVTVECYGQLLTN